VVHRNVDDLMQNARPSNSGGNGNSGHPTRDKPQLFPDISSRDVNAYLSDILPGLTAKVFRTHHATMAVQQSLAESEVRAEDPEHVKWEAASLANLEAAVLCNHTKKASANWARTRQRYRERIEKAGEKVAVYRERLREQRLALVELRKEAREKRRAAPETKKEQVKKRYEKRIQSAQKRIARTEGMLERAVIRRDKIRAQASLAGKKRTWNLGTSLKSYIDPRVYYDWAVTVDYDVLEKYYPAALRRKFAWVKQDLPGEGTTEKDGRPPAVAPTQGLIAES
jgi:DNA topoisomerase-1